jgi:hypothetical protein
VRVAGIIPGVTVDHERRTARLTATHLTLRVSAYDPAAPGEGVRASSDHFQENNTCDER